MSPSSVFRCSESWVQRKSSWVAGWVELISWDLKISVRHPETSVAGPTASLSQPACLSLSQNVVSNTTGLGSALATLATGGTLLSAPSILPALAIDWKSVPVCVSASMMLPLATASCCHLVRRVGTWKLVSPSEKKHFLGCWDCLFVCFCFFFGPVFLATGPSPVTPLVKEKEKKKRKASCHRKTLDLSLGLEKLRLKRLALKAHGKRWGGVQGDLI